MGSASTQLQEQEDQEPNSYFDLIPDHILHLILNKVLDAKTLARCLSLSKRFASIIPQTHAVSLSLFFPPRPRDALIRLSGNPVNILKYVVNYLISKPLHYFLRRDRRRDSLSDSPCQCPARLLRTFHHITHLHFELHGYGYGYGSSVDAGFLKWKATYGSQLQSCVILCATSFQRGSVPRAEPTDETTSSSAVAVPNEEFKSRIVWAISCLIAASARHLLLKQILLQIPTLRSFVFTDAKRQGRFSMEEDEIRDLRDSLKQGSVPRLSPEMVVPDVRMRMWYVPELHLPELGCTMKGATLLVIGPADEETAAEAEAEAEEKGTGSGFDGDATEKSVFAEAEREIVKKKNRSYVMEVTSF